MSLPTDPGPASSRGPGPRRLDRAIDLGALLLVATGAGLYLYSLWRMHAIAAAEPAASARLGAALDEWWALRRLSNVGLGVAGLGVLVGAVAFVRFTLRTRTSRTRDHGQAHRS